MRTMVVGSTSRGPKLTLGCVYKAWLVKLKLRAIRTGTLFRALPRIDRVLLEGSSLEKKFRVI